METIKYINAIRKNICEICCDSDEEGKCSLSKGEICAVENYLPQIIRLIHQSNTDDINKQYEILRDEICAKCRTSESKDKCYLREEVNCSLDRYFPLIIETIRKVDSGKII
ncbi:MAG: hypothetical protein CO129_01215 [Ignavibacteriales bacterium CG_4_9_14_3_um_filter_34_10]|nr:MAG: hypothetical protein CO129_01215 [Ignavibacteriales bacterium CG_4_9_14_3_um_filter_34_10]